MQNIIVLCHVAPFITEIRSALLARAPHLTVVDVPTVGELRRIDMGVILNARLIAFTTDAIVPAWVLAALGYGAYNFHPGPPEYPGWAPTCFALYDGARSYGATAHEMLARVDTGAIVGVERFPLAPDATHGALVGGMVASLMRLFHRLVGPLASGQHPPEPVAERWGPIMRTKAMARDLCRISLGMGQEEVVRRVRAFGSGWAGCRPAVRLHGFDFLCEVEN